MDLSSKTTDLFGDVSALGVGILAWMKTSTRKLNETGATLQAQFEDALASTLGKSVVLQLDSKYAGAADLHPSVLGWINKTTGAGILLGIADYFAGEVYPPYSKDFDGLRKVVQGAATGLTLGGAIGGIFDPKAGYTAAGIGSPSSAIVGGYGAAQGQPSGGIVTGNVPFARGEAGIGRQISVVA